MRRNESLNNYIERRREARVAKLRNHRIEIKLSGQPLYQFKVTDVSPQGAGILINASSRFLDNIEEGQIIDVNFISPRGEAPAGWYQAEIRHISEMENSPYRNLKRIGIFIMGKLDESD